MPDDQRTSIKEGESERERSDREDDQRKSIAEFEIPNHPERRFTRSTVRHAGGAEFTLTPVETTSDLDSILSDVLEDGPYRYGDWFDLPMTVFLVHDGETHDTFRVSVRDGTVRLHVLPETEPSGLKAIYDRLNATTESGWTIDRRVVDA